MRPARIVALVLGLSLVGALTPAGALAAATATTANATSITDSSAELNAVIDPTYADSAWEFEYSTTAEFSSDLHFTAAQPTGSGVRAVSAAVRGLDPSTVYFYRVLVYHQADTTNGSKFDSGNTVDFTTQAKPYALKPADGQASVVRSMISVAHGVAPITMTCAGTVRALCKGRLGLSFPGKPRSMTCGSGEFIASVPHTHTVRVHLAPGCARMLSAAPRHRLTARLVVTFSTHQARLTRSLVLDG